MSDAAELKTRREMTGASLADMARALGYEGPGSEASYQRYERGARGVPDYVWALVDRLEAWIDATVASAVADAGRHPGQVVTLTRWASPRDYADASPDAGTVPYAVHSRAIGVARAALLGMGVAVDVEYFSPNPLDSGLDARP
ncbi:hypothetical protein GCM10009785_26580 [Brooklawnia cerclae]|uniref:Transcriptional regulator with XRE-family HTH domain n=1 Tax=Brooklawnia cerclae TaxID=349934 RepID=A0ABX0SKS8_9ACTN|nr:helix-turn-helix transcriptional regulator [Brooklawnia cerclae]NIH57336.1 transcriptional regulator with XRE-family HTH domain [Brooklawnia cerclae]